MNRNNIKVSLCSVPVEGWGVRLDRKRSDGSLGIAPKVAIVSLVDAMRKANFPESSWDFNDIDMLYPSDEEVREYFVKYKPDVVGLSAVVSTSFSQVKRLSSIIRRELPNCWIVMGGNLSACSETVLKKTDIDISVVGDGEVAWIKILNHIMENSDRKDEKLKLKLGEIRGVAFLDKNEKINLNGFGQAIPAEEQVYPDYDVLMSGLKDRPEEFQNYLKAGLETDWFGFDERAKDKNRGKYIGQLFTSKGCVARCTFCQRSTKGYRIQPLEHLENHLKFLKENHDVGFIHVLDENFGSDKKHAYKVADIFHKHNLLWFASGVRCKSTTSADVKYYKDRGCSSLKYGIESGSQKILDMMEKVFNVEDIEKALTACFEHEVFSPINVMLGMPGEDETTAKTTGQFVGRITSKLGVHFKYTPHDIMWALPLPGTPLWEYGEQLEVIGKKDDDVVNYLTTVSDAGCFRRYYINLNGAPISEVLFWEYLVLFEASRTFHKLNNVNEELTNKYKEKYCAVVSSNPRQSLRYTALQFTTITYLIDTYCVGNKFFDMLPKIITYPIVKYLLYFEYQIQKIFARNRKNNIFAYTKKVKRVAHEDGDAKSSRKRSLRGIVAKNRKPANEVVGIEKARELLRLGL